MIIFLYFTSDFIFIPVQFLSIFEEFVNIKHVLAQNVQKTYNYSRILKLSMGLEVFIALEELSDDCCA